MQEGDQVNGFRGWWRRWRARAEAERARVEAARALYHAAVARARREKLYAELGVPDTPDGRFEMLGIEIAVLMRRLRNLGAEGSELTRSLLEVLVEDLDRNLRELGVGDLSVGRYVKRMVGSLLLRAEELERALDRHDEAALCALVRRTVWPSLPQPPEHLTRALAAEILAAAELWRAVPDAALRTGRVDSALARLGK